MRYMYKQLISPPYCLVITDIDNMTFAQFMLYFASEEEVRGDTPVSTVRLKEILEGKNPKRISRAEFLRRGEEIRKRKKKEFEDRRQRRIIAAQGMGKGNK